MDTSISRTYDPDLVRSIMTHPEIWATAENDLPEPELFMVDVHSDCWLVVTNQRAVIGLYKLHPHNSCTLEIHAQILPEFRDGYAKHSSREVLRWILEHSPNEYQKVIAQIPVIYPNVIHFTKNAGFQEEGINRLSFRKGGQLHDQVYLGITRDEIRSFLRGLN